MKTDKTQERQYTSRMKELQEKFRNLEPDIKDPEIKKALSVMNGMIQEVWRKSGPAGEQDKTGLSLKDISTMYKNAPKMEGPAVCKPVKEGSSAPDFALSDANGHVYRLSELRSTPVLLVFYPLDWSPGCSQQLDLYQQEYAEFENRGIKIFGISVDSIYSHGAWAAIRNIGFPLLSDFNPKGEVARKFQVFRDNDGFSERALFIIDREGIIRYSYVSPFLHHVPDIYELLDRMDKIKDLVSV